MFCFRNLRYVLAVFVGIIIGVLYLVKPWSGPDYKIPESYFYKAAMSVSIELPVEIDDVTYAMPVEAELSCNGSVCGSLEHGVMTVTMELADQAVSYGCEYYIADSCSYLSTGSAVNSDEISYGGWMYSESDIRVIPVSDLISSGVSDDGNCDSETVLSILDPESFLMAMLSDYLSDGFSLSDCYAGCNVSAVLNSGGYLSSCTVSGLEYSEEDAVVSVSYDISLDSWGEIAESDVMVPDDVASSAEAYYGDTFFEDVDLWEEE